MSNKKVIVPQAQLDNVEAARLALYELLEPQLKDNIQLLMAVTNITQPLWVIANTKWKEVDE